MPLRLVASWLLLLVTGFTCASSAPVDTGYLDALDACIAQQFSGDDDSPSLNAKLSLEDECPLLHAHLGEINSGLSPALADESSLNRLLDERHLLRPAQPVATALDHERVNTILAGYDFNRALDEDIDWWTRFKNWLKEKYANDNEDNSMDWLIELLENISIPGWLGETIFYVSIAIIILLAVVILYNELRQVRRFQHRDSRATESPEFEHIRQLRRLSWDEVRALPVQQQPAAVLQYLVQHFINRGLVADNLSHTNRELYRELRHKQPGMAEQFSHVIDAAERDLYGNRHLSEAELTNVLGLADMLAHGNGEAT